MSNQRYFIWFSYDGTAYHGWQRQPAARSVQQVLEEALSLLLRREVSVTAAGRTDAGVHARHMAAHFDVAAIDDCAQLAYRLNKLLPHDIGVQLIEPVAPDLHARYGATSRTYHYYLHLAKDPFSGRYSWYTGYQLDFGLMNEAAALLLGYDDFASFCKAHTDVKTTLCHVSEALWVEDAPGHWHFRITANRFLRNMVRAVVGTLIEVGRHRITPGQFCRIVESRQRTRAGESMPAHALFLEEVRY